MSTCSLLVPSLKFEHNWLRELKRANFTSGFSFQLADLQQPAFIMWFYVTFFVYSTWAVFAMDVCLFAFVFFFNMFNVQWLWLSHCVRMPFLPGGFFPLLLLLWHFLALFMSAFHVSIDFSVHCFQLHFIHSAHSGLSGTVRLSLVTGYSDHWLT